MKHWSLKRPNLLEQIHTQLSEDDTYSYFQNATLQLSPHDTGEAGVRVYHVVTGNSFPHRVCTRESNPVKLEWFFDAVSRNEEEKISVTELSNYIKGLNSIIGEGRYSMLEHILNDSVKLGASTRILLAFARASYPVRSKIIGWRVFLKKVSEKLDAQGKDSNQLLKGMI